MKKAWIAVVFFSMALTGCAAKRTGSITIEQPSALLTSYQPQTPTLKFEIKFTN